MTDTSAASATVPAPYKYTFEDQVSYFTPVYEKAGHIYKNAEDKPATFMGSLNAGDEQLYIGGGAINKAFNIAIRADDYDTTLYALSTQMHLSCYMDCYNVEEEEDLVPDIYSRTKYLNKINTAYFNNKKEGTLHHFNAFKEGGKFADNPYIADMYLYVSESRLTDFISNGLYPGDIFIDILKKPPYNNEANKAMLYCVGPKGLRGLNGIKGKHASTADDFKDAVYIVGKNIANAIYLYNNNNNTPDTEKIDYVRICLISGGGFKHEGVSHIEVAESLIKGIHEVNEMNEMNSKKQITNVVYNFAYDNDAFRQAYNNLGLKD
jgi:hypothetical protein